MRGKGSTASAAGPGELADDADLELNHTPRPCQYANEFCNDAWLAVQQHWRADSDAGARTARQPHERDPVRAVAICAGDAGAPGRRSDQGRGEAARDVREGPPRAAAGAHALRCGATAGQSDVRNCPACSAVSVRK